MKNILLFASGGGSNVRAILEYFKNRKDIGFPLLVCNNPRAGVFKVAEEHGIDVMLVNRQVFESEVLQDTLDFFKPDLLVLAGFLWKIPPFLVEHYPGRILNIHPALLPKYGGKGMYGHHVHQAVIEAGEKESGITIHLVNQHYDEGTILLQKKVAVSPGDTPDMLAKNVLKLEHEWYPRVIESVLGSK